MKYVLWNASSLAWHNTEEANSWNLDGNTLQLLPRVSLTIGIYMFQILKKCTIINDVEVFKNVEVSSAVQTNHTPYNNFSWHGIIARLYVIRK